MKLSRIFNARIIILMIVISIILGFLISLLITGIEFLIYPENYKDIVFKYSEQYTVPSELIFAVIKVESNFDKDAISRVGAVGLMQILPSTFDDIAPSINESSDPQLLTDPEVNIKAGVYYLRYLYLMFGSWEKAIIAYNWGLGHFKNFLAENGYTEGDYDSIPVRETRNYVKQVMHHWQKYIELYE